MSNVYNHKNLKLKVYHGYGHQHNLVLYGHVLKQRYSSSAAYTNNIVANIKNLLLLFMVTPVAGATVKLKWNSQIMQTVTEKDGFFKFEWKSEAEVSAGWHNVYVNLQNGPEETNIGGEGKIFVPHITQFGFISDIDDTVLVSHSATVGKRLKVLFTRNAHTRQAFDNVVTHYNLLSKAGITEDVANPFFYVSSSEWNLYQYLSDFFNHNKLPEGIFLLNQIKQWSQLVKTGKTQHDGKLLRVMRIIDAFPNQQFILLGDNSQQDPNIYTSIALKYPKNIFAVYIRNIKPANEAHTKTLLGSLTEKGVHTCLFNNNLEAIKHSQSIGLITLDDLLNRFPDEGGR